jgi:transglutaminase-like putative cysteine protease
MKRLLLLVLLTSSAFADAKFHVRHVARISNLPADAPAVRIWVPLPVSTAWQVVDGITLDSDLAWEIVTEPEFGNRYAYTLVSGRENVTLEITYDAVRTAVAFDAWRNEPLTADRRARSLRADRLVTLSPRIRELAARVTAGETTPLGKAQAIYRHVLGAMRYDKTLPGWGSGDTERACDVGAGNCTDFHSLFMSLARASGIPARFVMGLPLPAAGGLVPGYHCWAEFYVDGRGWIPVDISDASKLTDPARREFFFGGLDPNRLQLTTGRDVVLPHASSAPVNYSFLPYAERGAESVGCATLEVTYRRH